MNCVQLLGRLSRDPELRYTASNVAVCNLTIVDNKKYKDGAGEWQEKVSFIEATAWAGKAENIAKYFRKGQRIAVVGELEQETWEQQGQKRSKLKVRVNDFDFCESQSSSGHPRQSAPQTNHQALDEQDIPF